MINTVTIGQGAAEETYECQECGETKKIYEIAATIEPQSLYSAEEPTPEVTLKVEEEQEKDYMEVKLSETSAGNPKPENIKEQPKTIKIKKRKRRFFKH